MLKFKNILLWTIACLLIFVTLGFAVSSHNKKKCIKIDINFKDSLNRNFIGKGDIIELIKGDREILGQKFDKINISEIEKKIFNHPVVKKVEVFKTIDGVLKIELFQRNPIVRVVNVKNESFYIDEEGEIMPLSDKYNARVLVANGWVYSKINTNEAINILNLTKKHNKDKELLIKLYYLAKFIYTDKFWKAQIEQIYVNNGKEFELIPRVGAHIIFFGGIDNLEKKFRKLRIFYKKGLSKKNWNRYKFINLKFDNQVVCTKR